MLQSTHANPLFMLSSLFFFNDTATTEIYTLSLHDALPICLYELPFHLNVSAFYNARQGYPFERGILTPSRANGGNTVFLLLDPTGDSRLPNYQNLDFHVERPVRVQSVRFIPSLDVFNVSNANTIQAIRGTQNAANANQIQAILAPRVVRFGIRFNW